MAKQRIISIPETKGSFEVLGITSGCEKNDFYTEGKTRTQKPMRKVKFNLKVNKSMTVSEVLNGYTKDKVYFGKKDAESKSAPWSERFKACPDGYNLMGINIGLEKEVNSEGVTKNKKEKLVEFDACETISKKMTDKMSVYTKGKLEYGSMITDQGEMRRFVQLIPNQISLCKEIDFKSDDFEEKHNFTQVIVFRQIEQEKKDDNPTGRAIVSVYIVKYESIEEAEFIIEKQDLIKNFRTLKPYTAIKVWGNINSSQDVMEVVVSDDTWGEENTMEKANSSFKREFVITGADKSSIEKETYSKEKMEQAIEIIRKNKSAENDFAEKSDSWGDSSSELDDEEVW